jgi:two-component system OmpR family response regulator
MSAKTEKQGRRPRVLVVDDDPDLVRIVCDLLAANGYDTLTAGDGLDGLLEGLDDDPLDLVILDIMMPKAEGISVLNTLKGVRPELPVIMLTAKTAPEDILKGYRWGCDSYITKPFDPDELLAEAARLTAAVGRAA